MSGQTRGSWTCASLIVLALAGCHANSEAIESGDAQAEPEAVADTSVDAMDASVPDGGPDADVGDVADASDAPPAWTGPMRKSSLPRSTSPSVTGAELATMGDGTRAFAIDLYRQLASRNPGKSIFFSPWNLSVALAMAWGGARGATASQMASAARFALPPDKQHAAFNALALAIASDSPATGKTPFQFHAANGAWAQPSLPVEAGYLDLLAVHYGTGVYLIDPAPAGALINEWVAAQTFGRIKDVVDDALDPAFAIASALYFKAGWKTPFPKHQTTKTAFHALDGGAPVVDMMGVDLSAPYLEKGNLEVVALPYDGHAASMVLVVPKSGTFATEEAALDSAGLGALMTSAKPTSLYLRMPRFRIDQVDYALRAPLEALGMPAAFDPLTADFRDLSSTALFIADVFHSAFVAVDEDGTEAAAATVITFDSASSDAAVARTLTVDRPFLFFVRDDATGTILFAGRFVGP